MSEQITSGDIQFGYGTGPFGVDPFSIDWVLPDSFWVIVIWEHPNKDASVGLYIAGIDSYDYDESSTTSLGSCFNIKEYSL